MARARSEQIDLNVTSYYHCYVRCVRKAYLCGLNDEGKDCNHRRGWIANQLKKLPQYFAIDVVSYAVMHNHYHVVLHVDRERALSWSAEEVRQRWRSLTKGHLGERPIFEEIERWRENLYNISWFMRFINESIAVKANQEDDVKGRFWEGRFRSQALMDEGALLACSTYVDLNPVRAGIALGLEDSDYTSIQERVEAYQQYQQDTPTPPSLMPFQSEEARDSALPFSLKDYLALVEWTGRRLRDGKGFIAADVPSIVREAHLNPEQWLQTVKHYGLEYQGIMGAFHHVQAWASKLGRKFLRNQNLSKSRYLCFG